MKTIRDMLYNKNRTIRFYKYMFSYIIFVVLLLAASGSIINSGFISTFQSEIEASNVAALRQVRNTIDMRIKEMERMSVRISDNPNLTPFELANGGDISCYYAVRELNDYRANNAFLYDIALYYSHGDNSRIYAASGPYSLEMFFDRIYRYESFSKEEFLQTLESIKFPLMRPVEKVKLSGYNNMELATYMYPLPINSGKPYGSVIYLIEQSTLRGIVQDTLKDYNGYVYILNEKNRPILSVASEKTFDEPQSILDMLNVSNITKTITEALLNNKQYSVVKLNSEYNSWTYLTVMPTAQFMKKVHNIRQVLYVTAAAVLLIGVIMSFFFANSSYKPLRKLAEALKGQVQKNNGCSFTDEIDFISSTIKEVTQNQGILSSLKSKSGMLKDQLLLSLIHGKNMAMKDIDHIMEFANMKFNQPFFVVLMFLIDDYEAFRTENTEPMQDILKYSIVNVLEELSMEIGCGYGADLEDDRGIVLILNVRQECNDDKHYIELVSKAKEFFKQHFGLALTTGIGNVYEDMAKLNISYLEAQNAAYYRLIKGKDCIIFYKNLQQEREWEYKHSSEQNLQLMMYIKQGKTAEAKEVIEALFSNAQNWNASPEAVQYSYFILVNTIIKVLDEMDIDEAECLGDKVEHWLTMKFETVEVMKIRLTDLCQRVCVYVDRQKKSSNSNLSDRIMAYINENYSDNNLGVDIIADMFGLSPSYITRFLKDQTGYSLKQYLDMQRMNKAKELLKYTDFTLKDIINKVGYLDETNFIRKFKKLENMTPIQYRNLTGTGSPNERYN